MPTWRATGSSDGCARRGWLRPQGDGMGVFLVDIDLRLWVVDPNRWDQAVELPTGPQHGYSEGGFLGDDFAVFTLPYVPAGEPRDLGVLVFDGEEPEHRSLGIDIPEMTLARDNHSNDPARLQTEDSVLVFVWADAGCAQLTLDKAIPELQRSSLVEEATGRSTLCPS